MSQETLSFTPVEAQKPRENKHVCVGGWWMSTPENLQQEHTWFSVMQDYLKKPQAAEWKEGPIRSREKGEKRPLYQKYLALENKAVNKSFIISTFTDHLKYRHTAIKIADFNGAKNGRVRGQFIDILHDEKGQIVGIRGEDSKKAKKDDFKAWENLVPSFTEQWESFPPGTFTKEEWNKGGCAKGDLFTGRLTLDEIEALLNELGPQLQNASIDEAFTKQIRDYQKWVDKYVIDKFHLEQHIYPTGNRWKIKRAEKQLMRLKEKEPRPKLRKETNVHAGEKAPQVRQSEQSTPQSCGIIPLHILQDKDFAYVYSKIKAELTQYGRKEMSDQAIDRYVRDTYQVKKAEILGGKKMDVSTFEKEKEG